MRAPVSGFGGAFPFAAVALGRRSRFFDSGEIRVAILSLLKDEPRHGYQLMKEMSDRSGGVYKASAGSVYPTLQQLEDEKLIKAEMVEGRRTYALTKAGRKALKGDRETARRIWDRAEAYEGWSHCMAPEALMIYGPLVELFKCGVQAAGRLARRSDGSERIRAILDRARKELEELR